MNLRDLQYLVAVADHQHFGKAAESCYVSQPTLSQQIKKLEEYLCTALFERDHRSVRLTPIGQEIVGRARKVLQEADGLVQLAKSAGDPAVGELRIGAFPTLAPYYLPKVLPMVRKRLPDLKLYLVEDKTPNLLSQLQSGELDAALLALPIRYEGLDAVPLLEESFWLAVAKDHPLAKRKSVSVDDMHGLSLMLLEDGHCLRDQALEVCQLAGAHESTTFKASSLETLRQMVASGLGVTLLPEMALRQDDHGIRYLPIKDAPSRQVALVYRASTARRQSLVLLIQALRKAYEQVRQVA